ncbi:hypothetical protein WI560_22765 [Bradyrhizobium sp. A11]|uniref:hypothetical protein n=1 Tax=Bradyrhizobium sp. A11 TaxID=3133974 RepID=UPI0032446C51
MIDPRGHHPPRVFSSRLQNRTVAAHPATHSTNLERRSARRRPNHCWPCTRERAGLRRWGRWPAPLRSPEDTEIGFAPETIVLRLADLPRIFFAWRMMMTAYLISLALTSRTN